MKIRKCDALVLVALLGLLAMPVATFAQANPSENHKPKHHIYKMIKGVNVITADHSHFLNNHGTVVGGANTTTLNPYGCINPFNNSSDCYVQHAAEWHDGTVTDLGALPGGNNSFAYWISGNGLVAGGSELATVDPNTGLPEYHAVLWLDEQIVDLGTLGGPSSLATAVNNRGQVTGVANNTIPDPFSSPPSTEGHAFLWAKGKMHDLGTLGGPDSFAQYSNRRGQIAGVSYTSDTADPTTGVPQLDPFLWENGEMKDLGNFGGQNGLLGPFVYGLNNRGEVVGSMVPAGVDVNANIQHAFLWDGEKLNDLGTLGQGDYSDAEAINEAGVVIGRAAVDNRKFSHATLWKNGEIKDLGTLAGDRCSQALSINSKGQIVGASQSLAGGCEAWTTGFLWEDGGPIVDLNALVVPSSSLHIRDGSEINDRGEISGSAAPPGCNTDSCAVGVLLVPVGDCDDDCEARIAASQNNAADVLPANPIISPSNINPLHNQFGRRGRPGTSNGFRQLPAAGGLWNP